MFAVATNALILVLALKLGNRIGFYVWIWILYPLSDHFTWFEYFLDYCTTFIHVYYVYLYVCVQCEDASSVRSRNAEPPSPESLRRRKEALYADSRCVFVLLFQSTLLVPTDKAVASTSTRKDDLLITYLCYRPLHSFLLMLLTTSSFSWIIDLQEWGGLDQMTPRQMQISVIMKATSGGCSGPRQTPVRAHCE